MKIQAIALGLFLTAAPFLQCNAITYGEPDGGAHPYVGLILFFGPGNTLTPCSGTLISPTVVLTAAHCAENRDSAYVWFNDAVPQDFSIAPIVGMPIENPDFDDFATFPNTHDIAAVVLQMTPNVSTYAQLPELGLLDSLSTQRGRQNRLFTVVGYGADSLLPHDSLIPPDPVVKRKATTMFINLRSALTDGYNLQTSNHPGRGQGTGGSCLGDSGGPILLDVDGVPTVVGIVSFGQNGLCRGVGFNYRTDIPESQEFLNSIAP